MQRKSSQHNLRHVHRHIKKTDPVLFAILRTMAELKPLPSQTDHTKYFEHLCREIIGQQLAGSAARAIWARFVKLFPGGRVTPGRVLTQSEAQLRSIGLSWAKARYVRSLAEHAKARKLRFAELHMMDNEAVIAELMQVKGIGRWTAEMFLIFTLGREDVFSPGDLVLRKSLERLYGKRRAGTLRGMHRITERWSPYRTYGSLALWHLVDTEKETKKKS